MYACIYVYGCMLLLHCYLPTRPKCTYFHSVYCPDANVADQRSEDKGRPEDIEDEKIEETEFADRFHQLLHVSINSKLSFS